MSWDEEESANKNPLDSWDTTGWDSAESDIGWDTEPPVIDSGWGSDDEGIWGQNLDSETGNQKKPASESGASEAITGNKKALISEKLRSEKGLNQKRATEVKAQTEKVQKTKAVQPFVQTGSETTQTKIDMSPAGLAALKEVLDAGKANAPESVTLMQHALRALGHKLKLTGFFDKASLNALRTFQMMAKLPISGCLDGQTRQRLVQVWEKRLNSGAEPEKTVKKKSPVRPRFSHPEELPRFENMACLQLEQDLSPEDQGGVSSGAEVELLQKILILKGFELVYSGKYDKATYAAVRKFQLKEGLAMTGLIGPRARKRLNILIKKAQTLEAFVRKAWYVVYPYRKFNALLIEDEWELIVQFRIEFLLQKLFDAQLHADQTPAQMSFRERPLLTSLLGTPGQLGVISKGPEVERLKEVLRSLGYMLNLNQSFDLQTFEVLKQYQADQGLQVTGMADLDTCERLNQHLQKRYEYEKAFEKLWLIVREYQQEMDLLTSDALETEITDTITLLLEETFLPLTQDFGPANRMGCKSFGAEVLLLKLFLLQQGHSLESSMFFDSACTEALRKTQRDLQLPTTGLLDAKTRLTINQKWEADLKKHADLSDGSELIY